MDDHGVRARGFMEIELAAKMSADVAIEVHLRECVIHTPLPSVNKAT